jgi:hypothetical protein
MRHKLENGREEWNRSKREQEMKEESEKTEMEEDFKKRKWMGQDK